MFCTNCGKELKPGAKFCTTCGCPVDADDAGETKVVSSPDETFVVSPDTTTVSEPAAETSVVSPDTTTVSEPADETTVIPEPPAAPEHDREADTAAAVASFDDVEPAPAPAYAAPAPVPPAPAGEAPKKKGHGALIIGIVVLIAVLAVGGALYVRLHGGRARAGVCQDARASQGRQRQGDERLRGLPRLHEGHGRRREHLHDALSL
ncbi:zinc-ribbon domain-containing protein [Parolsenella catena]|uniref:zinc-ribbon domain-containing protein n=1 Tax=Parolsenella catena TaxID=2003188 RepID=UPI0018987825